MVQTVIMPKFGQTVEESTIVKWHKNVGEDVKKGDILFEMETDKAVLEVESFFEGTLLKIVVQEGETVPVTSAVAFIGQPGDPIPAVTPIPRPVSPQPAKTALPASVPSAGAGEPVALRAAASLQPLFIMTAQAPPSGPLEPVAQRRQAISPRARSLIRESAISPDPIRGTGQGGRIVEKDVLAYLAACRYDAIRITPAAKALAIKENINILNVESSGDRITVQDIQQAIAEKPKNLSRIRRLIADRMTRSFTTVPHFFATVSVDMTDLLALRKTLKRQGKPYSVTDFILKAVAMALMKFPAVNSATDGRTIRWHSRVHLGMAVAIKDGLVVPVIRNAHEIGLPELHDAVTSMAAKARDGKLTPDEMTGSTFTVSNMGMLSVENFTAIINPGESAILAVSSTRKEPAVVGNSIVIRSIMKMTLSSDHRIVDGSTAAGFINEIKTIIEDTERWKNLT